MSIVSVGLPLLHPCHRAGVEGFKTLGAGAIAVAQMCKKNNTLTELYLGSNGIAEDGCTALVGTCSLLTDFQ